MEKSHLLCNHCLEPIEGMPIMDKGLYFCSPPKICWELHKSEERTKRKPFAWDYLKGKP